MINIFTCTCGSENLVVRDSREMANGCRRRTRVCQNCKKRYYTVEMSKEDADRIENIMLNLDNLKKAVDDVEKVLGGEENAGDRKHN